VEAQTTNLALSGIQWDLETPGVRALGLGGTSAAFGDDVSVIASNPAALTTLGGLQTTVAFRGADINSAIPVWTENRVSSVNDMESITGVDFAGVTYSSTDWSVGGFYRTLLSNSMTPGTRDEVVGRDPITDSQFHYQRGLWKSRSAMDGPGFSPYADATVEGGGVALAIRMTPQWSAGVSIGYYSLDFKAAAWERTEAFRSSSIPLDGKYSILRYDTQDDDNKTSAAATVSVRWEFLDGRGSMSLGYAKSPQFSIASYDCYANAAGCATPETLKKGADDTAEIGLSKQLTRFDLADMASLGFSFRPSRNLKVGLELDYIFYSMMARGVVTSSYDKTIATTSIGIEPSMIATAADFKSDDVLVSRLGVEYIIRAGEEFSVALRAGGYKNPAHRTVFNPKRFGSGDAANEELQTIGDNYFLKTAFGDKGKDESHVSVGLGLEWKGMQFDFGYDWSNVDTVRYGGSMTYRF
jgi:hypothetical protein